MNSMNTILLPYNELDSKDRSVEIRVVFYPSNLA